MPTPLWKPGQSGNPAGRARGYGEFMALCRTHSMSALRALVRALDRREERVAAAKVILSYAWGRPVEKVQLVDEADSIPSHFANLTFEQKLKLFEALGDDSGDVVEAKALPQ